MAEREVRIAAVGDVHFDETRHGGLRELFARMNQDAEVLLLCGDLTTHGRPEQMRGFVDELAGVEIPIVAVLGNHDFDANATGECIAILHDRGVYVLEGDQVEVEGIGFAGVKGFGGGFGRSSLGSFGEPIIKDFVQATVDDALKLENALRALTTETRVVVLHYAPIVDTVQGEPEPIWPFLGSSRLLQPIDTLGADVVFHGHAHHGSVEGRTPAGIPVYNVSHPLLQEQRGEDFMIWTARAPERRAPRGEERRREKRETAAASQEG